MLDPLRGKKLHRDYCLVCFMPFPATEWDRLGLKPLALRVAGDDVKDSPIEVIGFTVCQGREMECANIVKSILAIAIFRKFPGLKRKRFWGSGLWSRGTYYGSAGNISGSTIMRYIEQQKEA